MSDEKLGIRLNRLAEAMGLKRRVQEDGVGSSEFCHMVVDVLEKLADART